MLTVFPFQPAFTYTTANLPMDILSHQQMHNCNALWAVNTCGVTVSVLVDPPPQHSEPESASPSSLQLFSTERNDSYNGVGGPPPPPKGEAQRQVPAVVRFSLQGGRPPLLGSGEVLSAGRTAPPHGQW